MRIKFTAILLITIAISALGIGTLMAQTPEPEPPVSSQQLLCDGHRDWSVFVSATLDFGNFVEYWKDLTVRYNTNLCHYTDIENLMKRLRAVRRQIRDAFYACADTTRMQENYYELEAELFFLRRFINADNGQFLVTNEQALLNEMRDFFVTRKEHFSNEELDQLFATFIARYRARLESYNNCSDPTWGQVVQKWNQFKATAGGVAPALQQAQERTEKVWDRMAQTDLNLGRDFLGGYVDARINNLPPEEGLYQITQELEENFPDGYTFDQLQAAQTLSTVNFQYQQLEADYLAQYQGLYAQTSDELTARAINRLQTLQDIITQTYPFQNQTIQCVASINARQCQ